MSTSTPGGFVPSRHLSPLARKPELDQIIQGLDNLALALGVDGDPSEVWFQEAEADGDAASTISADLEGSPRPADSNAEDEDGEEGSEERFERRWALSWLTRIVASGLDWIEQDDEEADENREDTSNDAQRNAECALDRAAELLSVCAGKSGMSRMYLDANVAWLTRALQLVHSFGTAYTNILFPPLVRANHQRQRGLAARKSRRKITRHDVDRRRARWANMGRSASAHAALTPISSPRSPIRPAEVHSRTRRRNWVGRASSCPILARERGIRMRGCGPATET